MNVYDFDGTIYRGDSSVDFVKYCIKKNRNCLKAIPMIGIAGILYTLKKISTKEFKECFFSFLKEMDSNEIDRLITEFWIIHKNRIATWYIKQHCEDDVVISASPRFLLEPIAEILGINLLIATEMNKNTGHIFGENCKGVEKVKRFREVLSGHKIGNFYSDSLSDCCLAEMADNAFLVNGDRIEPWSQSKG